jgi:CMP-N-acetylneuraminic acid synthetase
MFFTAVIPIKSRSQRLPDKNFKLLNGRPLFEHILHTLGGVDQVNEILVDTDCPEKLEDYCAKNKKIKLLLRPAFLNGDAVVMNQLLEYNLPHASNEHILQTHVTNPLLTKTSIEKALTLYSKHLPQHDSLFSVTKHQKRFYDQDGKPVNHSLDLMEQTQLLPPLYEENSNLFIFSKKSFIENQHNRIGKDPLLFELTKLESIDIDYEEDFRLAELLMGVL